MYLATILADNLSAGISPMRGKSDSKIESTQVGIMLWHFLVREVFTHQSQLSCAMLTSNLDQLRRNFTRILCAKLGMMSMPL
jgi:hypothetical protein